MRIDFDPDDTGTRAFYRLLTSVVVPRPIAWVSSRSAGGIDNLAPHSFFTVASTDPPIVVFTSVGDKDTLRNIHATREFVVHLTPEDLLEQVNATGTNFPPGISEFDAVGLEREASARVAAARVAAAPVALECVLHETVGIGNGTLVFGRVVLAAISDAVLDGEHPDVERLRPLSRLGRDEWGLLGDLRSIARIPFAP